METIIRAKTALVAVAVSLLSALLPGCDKLADGDATAQALPGRWAFSYSTAEPLGVALAYRYVVFGADGSCALLSDDDSLKGTYRAGDAVIRIVTTAADGEERVLLWRVLSLSPYAIVCECDYELSSGRRVVMTVTLDRVGDAAG